MLSRRSPREVTWYSAPAYSILKGLVIGRCFSDIAAGLQDLTPFFGKVEY